MYRIGDIALGDESNFLIIVILVSNDFGEYFDKTLKFNQSWTVVTDKLIVQIGNHIIFDLNKIYSFWVIVEFQC